MHATDMPGAATPFLPRLLAAWGALFRLAWPVMLSRSGLLALTLADFAMVGRMAPGELADLAMGYAIFMPILITGVGALVGVVAVTARHVGAGDRAEAAAMFPRGLAWAALVGLATTTLAALAPLWLALIGQSPALVAGGGDVGRMLAAGALFQTLFVAGSFWLEAHGRTLPGLVVMAGANAVNIAANALLIGDLGADGAALGSTLARAAMAAGILLYILALPEIRALPRALPWGPGGFAAGRELRVIGLASGAAFLFETVAFAGLNQVAGLISPEALAAYSIAHQVEAAVFMVALGLSVATAVRVGQARGAGRMEEARFAGWSGLAATMGTVALLAGLVVLFRHDLGALFTADAGMVARAAPLFVILACSLVFDGGQVVMGQANRALGDAWGTTLCFFAAFWLVMLPLGTWLGLATPLAELGLFAATALGCVIAVCLLAFRFHMLTRGPAR